MPDLDTDRGLLDLSVELSTRDITAANEFTLFVLVKNPFTKPVWVERVHVNLPSELALAVDKETQAHQEELETAAKKAEDSRKREREKERDFLRSEIGKVTERFTDLNNTVKTKADFEPTSELKNIENSLDKIQESLDKFGSIGANVALYGSEISSAILPPNSEVVLYSSGGVQSKISRLEMYEPTSEVQGVGREIRLQSSLPPGAPLQPSSTDVYKAVLKTRKRLLFIPSKYRLQFNVNFSFYDPRNPQQHVGDTPQILTNTISHELSMRASVWSIIAGSAFGGFVGSLARSIQLHPENLSAVVRDAPSMILAVVLSGVAVIFLARKSDAQSIISVEDFWGGALIGFFVGYTGTSFFAELTKLPTPAGR
jgi:hypothetical protein